MVELQSCAGLVNASSALCAIEQESKGESVNVISQMSDELQREKRRNAELMERISFLEAQLVEERVKDTQFADRQDGCSKATQRSFKRFKRSKEETDNNQNIEKNETMIRHDTQCLPPKGQNLEDRLVNWMNMDETQFMHYEKTKECDITADCVDTDDTDDEDYDYQEENDIRFEMKDWEINGNSRNFSDDPNMRCLGDHSAVQSKPTLMDEHIEAKECARSCLPAISEPRSEIEKNEAESIEAFNGIPDIIASGNEVYGAGSRNISFQRKPPKLAFLLFMAGFPDDLVRKETKYRNLDLLQKYYRTDKDAEGEELFLESSTIDIEDKSVLAGKNISTTSKGKKQSSTNEQPSSSHKLAVQQSSSSAQFGLVGYTSIQTHAVAAFQSLPSPSRTPVDHNHPIPNPVVASSCAVATSQNQNPLNYFPPNAFVPMIYWPPPNSFNPGLYPSAYNYHSFPSAGNYIPFQSRPYCSYPYSHFTPKALEKSAKNEDVSEETDSDSDSSSSSKNQNISTSCKQ